jgi:hypothetical protein
MGTNRHHFKQNDAARAIRAGKAAGFARPILEIDPATGRMSVRDGDARPDKSANEASADNDQAN